MRIHVKSNLFQGVGGREGRGSNFDYITTYEILKTIAISVADLGEIRGIFVIFMCLNCSTTVPEFFKIPTRVRGGQISASPLKNAQDIPLAFSYLRVYIFVKKIGTFAMGLPRPTCQFRQNIASPVLLPVHCQCEHFLF